MQGFNMGRYHAPSSLDSSLSTTTRKPPRNTPSSQPPTIRFELPLPIWCTTCQPESLLAAGLRFNAHKRRTGSYHTTPIWAFTFTHTPCRGSITISTDPARAAYVVTSGARARTLPSASEGALPVLLPGAAEPEAEPDPFLKLDREKTDKAIADSEAGRLARLKEARERDWSDPGAANARLRGRFRAEKRVRVEKEKEAEGVAARKKVRREVEGARADEGDGEPNGEAAVSTEVKPAPLVTGGGLSEDEYIEEDVEAEVP
ncbi:hypothetical protein EJ06DRAFT_550131 [Trichodelitschia bisporula]|uniref:DUF572-domain-containing protein n=1 Tax=Trichodelitschia bisporula TaxID=703511 RepID=A0A6G1HS02_9PEZI|nr:hypothetical protein EJ06DRAFT_550131 [Trichodelitschia bisporula]